MYEAIYIGNTQHKFKKILDSHFSNLLRYFLKISTKIVFIRYPFQTAL